MPRRLFLASILLFNSVVLAQSEVLKGQGELPELTSTSRISTTEVADHRNIFTSGIRGADLGSGFTLSYQRVIGGRFALGSSLAFTGGSDNKEGGSLDLAQYYKEDLEVKSVLLDVIGTYYFRSNGFGRWGWLLRGGIGHGWHQAKAKWGRYDRDPGVVIIADEKRLLESREFERKWSSTYARLGGYYQFVWGFRPQSSLGQVLELGIGVMGSDQGKEITYTKPNGVTETREVQASTGFAEISYSLAF